MEPRVGDLVQTAQVLDDRNVRPEQNYSIWDDDSMRRYYKGYAETDDGSGENYIEASGDLVVRQVEIYGDKIYWSTQQAQSSSLHRICDQPVSALDLTPATEITPEEFESVWRRAQQASSEAS